MREISVPVRNRSRLPFERVRVRRSCRLAWPPPTPRPTLAVRQPPTTGGSGTMYWSRAGLLLGITLHAPAAAQGCPPPSHNLRFSPDTTSAFDVLHPRYFVRVVEVAA